MHLQSLMAGFYQLSYIAAATNGTTQQNWVPNATALIQAVLGPLYECHAHPNSAPGRSDIRSISQAFASDTYQSRKIWLTVPCALATVGAAVAANVHNIYGVIGAQILIGFGFATVPLAYCIPSEVGSSARSVLSFAAKGSAVSI